MAASTPRQTVDFEKEFSALAAVLSANGERRT